MVTKIFGNIQCHSHSSSHGFLFFVETVKKSPRSPSLAPLSLPNTTPSRVSHLAAATSRSNALPSIVLGLSPSTERCCYRCLRSGEARVWFFYLIIWGQLPCNSRGRRSHLPAHHGKDGTDSATHIFGPALCDRVRIPRLLFRRLMASC